MLIGLIVLVVVVAVPVVALVVRLRQGEQAAGGSFGTQLSRRKRESWGPKP
jgi:hypothetical protein